MGFTAFIKDMFVRSWWFFAGVFLIIAGVGLLMPMWRMFGPIGVLVGGVMVFLGVGMIKYSEGGAHGH